MPIGRSRRSREWRAARSDAVEYPKNRKRRSTAVNVAAARKGARSRALAKAARTQSVPAVPVLPPSGPQTGKKS
jgi:hypothetical protein